MAPKKTTPKRPLRLEPKDSRIELRFPHELREQLRRASEKEERTMSDLIRRFVEVGLERMSAL